VIAGFLTLTLAASAVKPGPNCTLATQSIAFHLRYPARTVPDAELATFVTELSSIGSATNGNPGPVVREYAEKYFGKEGLELALPPTRPTSVSDVFLVQRYGTTVAAIKVFREGAASLTAELAAMDTLRTANLRHLKPVRMIDVKKLTLDGQPVPVLMMGAAKGVDLEEQIRNVGWQDPATLIRAVSAVGLGLGELHRTLRVSHDKVSPDRFTYNRAHEVKRVREALGEKRVLDSLLEKGWMTADELAKAKVAIEGLVADFEKSPADVVAVTHGDAHQGNFFFDSATGDTSTIDAQTLTYSLSAREVDGTVIPQGTCEANADVGRFLEALEHNGLAAHLSTSQIGTLQSAFMNSYVKESGFSQATAKQHVEFYRLRYFLITQYKPDGKKYDAETRQRILDQFLRRIGAR